MITKYRRVEHKTLNHGTTGHMTTGARSCAGGITNPEGFPLRRLRRSSAFAHGSLCIVGLLKTLGVPQQMLYVRRFCREKSFWLRPINHLEVLEQARNLYRRRISVVHPDKPGGCAKQAAELNQVWGEIERRFRNRGHEL